MRDKLENIVMLIICGIILLIGLAFIGLVIYAYVKYGGKTVDEIPAWALVIMFGGR
jgi:hypothetical protein